MNLTIKKKTAQIFPVLNKIQKSNLRKKTLLIKINEFSNREFLIRILIDETIDNCLTYSYLTFFLCYL